MRLNTKIQTRTHEGAPAKQIGVLAQLRRSVMACLLWESQFYESGVTIAERIASLVHKVSGPDAQDIATEAREKMNLRHVPLLIAREMARGPVGQRLFVANTLERIIQRPDELTEFLAIYWKDGKQSLSAQVKKGLAWAFKKFDAYQLAKYNRDGAVKLRDVMFLTHPRPDSMHAGLYKALAEGRLEPPDTWEVRLSSGADKKASWEALISERKLGAMALLKNLRNMTDVGVSKSLIREDLANMNASRVLPFRFISAAKAAPQFEPELEDTLLRSLRDFVKLAGETVVLVDVSDSMTWVLSEKSKVVRMDAACGLAMILRELCESVRVFAFSNTVKEVPPRRGFALRDAIVGAVSWGGTYLGAAIRGIQREIPHDRIIVLTDEQSHDIVPDPVAKRAYMVNVATFQHGVGYGAWTHIDGWSEATARYIQEIEKGSDESLH